VAWTYPVASTVRLDAGKYSAKLRTAVPNSTTWTCVHTALAYLTMRTSLLLTSRCTDQWRRKRYGHHTNLKFGMAATLEWIIQDHVHPGTVVVTDAWAGYANVNNLNNGVYQHEVLVHAQEFVHSIHHEIHNENTEWLWMHAKRKLRYQCGTSRSLFGCFPVASSRLRAVLAIAKWQLQYLIVKMLMIYVTVHIICVVLE